LTTLQTGPSAESGSAHRIAGPASGHHYVNPVTYENGPHTDPDPFVLRFRGLYYCYSTGETQVNVSVSRDMVHWTRLGAALQRPDRRHFWAPCVIYANGAFYMYFSDRPAEASDPHTEVLQLAVSTDPQGPFSVVHQFFDTFSIDPHVVPDGRGGYVMFYATNDVTGLDDECVGTSIVVDRLLDFDQLEGHPRPVIRPSIDEEIFERNRFGDGRDWYTIEGATYFTHGRHAFLTYSGNAYEREDYFIGYGRASLSGTPDTLQWHKYPSDTEYSPLVRRSAFVEGTGHNSIVRAPNLVDDWIVYHGRDADDVLVPGTEQRVMRIDALHYGGGRLITEAPTSEPMDAPAAPTVGDMFETDALREQWRLRHGSVAVGRGELRMPPSESTHVVTSHVSDAYVAEVYVRAIRSDKGARFGVIPAWQDDANFTEVVVDAVLSQMSVCQWTAGIGMIVASGAFHGTDASVWQRVSVTRSLENVTVAFGHSPELSFAVPPVAASVGLRSHRTDVRWSAFALTDHLALDGEQLGLIGPRLTASPPLAASAVGLGLGGARVTRLVGPRPTHAVTVYDFSFATDRSAAVATPWMTDAGDQITVQLSRLGYHIEVHRDGHIVADVAVNQHKEVTATSLRTVVHGDRAVVCVNGSSHHFAIRPGQKPHQSIELHCAQLSSFEQTTITDPAYQNHIAKEQS